MLERSEASRRRAVFAAATLAAWLFGLGCRSPEREPIRLGFVAGISGRAADLGATGRDGALLAVEELNTAGGVGGRPIELLVRDDKQQDERAAAAVRELSKAGVVAVIGPLTSATAHAALPVAEAEGLLLLSQTVSGDSLAGRDDAIFRLNHSCRALAEPLAAHVLRRSEAPVVAAIADRANRAHTESMLENFRGALERGGGRLAAIARFDSSGTTAFHPLVEAALAPRPEAVLVVANVMDAATICQHLRLQGFHGPILTSGWSLGSELLEHAGRAADGLCYVDAFDPNHHGERSRRFAAAFSARFGYPPSLAANHAYDAVRMIAASLKPPFDRSGLKRALLEAGPFDGLQGPIDFDEFGDPIRERYLFTVEQGVPVRRPLP